ncbi:unnamed protein product [Porites evermanni]|uniref:G-protein coupled receptors family 1 profile domain-containing protein n=1 Tax=Porites evermanni TaxID=104178 RepID=A0ABN8LLV3_9CNID|nr:unnamed protein product [Porites evermanni]
MTNQTNKSTINHPDDMSFSSVQVIAWSCALATEAVVIVVGNLLTIVLFALNKKLRSKKSLYLVLNMAFADLFLGGISLPTYVYSLALGQVKFDEQTPTLFTIIFLVFAQASFITATLISCERFYAIYWPLKHRQTLSTRAYRFVILTVWTLSFLGSLFTVFSPAILKPGGSEFFPVFNLRVCTSNHQRPQFWCLEKDSATNCSSSPKQSLAKTTLNKDFVISISHRHGFLASTFGL